MAAQQPTAGHGAPAAMFRRHYQRPDQRKTAGRPGDGVCAPSAAGDSREPMAPRELPPRRTKPEAEERRSRGNQRRPTTTHCVATDTKPENPTHDTQHTEVRPEVGLKSCLENV